MTGRLEIRSGEGSVILYPSFVAEFDPNNTSPEVERRIDCWRPRRTGDPALDFAEGARHFESALAVSRGNGCGAFLAYVLHAMADHEHCGDIERGFIKPLCSRAYIAGRPTIGRFSRLMHLTPEAQQVEEALIWDCLVDIARKERSPQILADLVECSISLKDKPNPKAVFLTVLAAAAYNGSAH